MNRLTERVYSNIVEVSGVGDNECRAVCEKVGNCVDCPISAAFNKLAEYEDLEEQGLLVRLPCPVGTTVYNTTWWDCVQEKVKVDGKTFYRTVHKHKVSKSTFSLLDICDFGKTIFLTKEEAEQKLKEMEGSK